MDENRWLENWIKMDERGWNDYKWNMKGDESGLKWMKVKQIGIWMKIGENGWKLIEVDESELNLKI